MKWSAIIALCAAPLALGSYLDADVLRRTEHKESVEKSKDNERNSKGGEGAAKGAANDRGNSVTVISKEVIIIWVNNGGGVPAKTMNEMIPANSATPGAPAAAAAATHHVMVGGVAGLKYFPETINAAVGDMVIFTFMSQNHTLTQTTFAEPCIKLEGGTASGFMPNPNNTIVPAPQMAMQVTVATPLWFYCAQGNHCGKGMVFSINPTAEKTHATFQSVAIAKHGSGTEAGIVGGTPSAAPAAPAVTADPAAPPAPAATPAAPAMPPQAEIVPGTGSIVGGSCACSCLCGVQAFPSAGQGIASFGGMTGALPMSLMEKRR